MQKGSEYQSKIDKQARNQQTFGDVSNKKTAENMKRFDKPLGALSVGVGILLLVFNMQTFNVFGEVMGAAGIALGIYRLTR